MELRDILRMQVREWHRAQKQVIVNTEQDGGSARQPHPLLGIQSAKDVSDEVRQAFLEANEHAHGAALNGAS